MTKPPKPVKVRQAHKYDVDLDALHGAGAPGRQRLLTSAPTAGMKQPD